MFLLPWAFILDIIGKDINEKSNKGVNSASKFRIVGFNANSIGRNPKRGKVFHCLKKKNPDFLFIFDTRIDKSLENSIREEWGGQCVFNSYSSQSRGVALFLKKGNLAKILDTSCDTEGNILSILMEYENRKILLEGVYGPNEDCPQFYENEVFKMIEKWQPDYSIFLGDFNVTINHDLDNKNYINCNNPLARQSLRNKIEELELIDIWRELNPQEQRFTWRKFRDNKMARLDYFLIFSSLLPYVQDSGMFSGSFSDHSGIFLDIDFARFQRGRGFWKFNSSLLKDREYVDIIKGVIKRVGCQYAIVNDDENYFNTASAENLNEFMNSQTPESLQALRLNINPQLFLDTLLLEIRRETIKFSSAKKRERVGKEQLLQHDIEALENQMQQAGSEADFTDLNNSLQIKKQELEEIFSYQAHGAYVRARAK